jgi:hypothetical protein
MVKVGTMQSRQQAVRWKPDVFVIHRSKLRLYRKRSTQPHDEPACRDPADLPPFDALDRRQLQAEMTDQFSDVESCRAGCRPASRSGSLVGPVRRTSPPSPASPRGGDGPPLPGETAAGTAPRGPRSAPSPARGTDPVRPRATPRGRSREPRGLSPPPRRVILLLQEDC